MKGQVICKYVTTMNTTILIFKCTLFYIFHVNYGWLAMPWDIVICYNWFQNTGHKNVFLLYYLSLNEFKIVYSSSYYFQHEFGGYLGSPTLLSFSSVKREFRRNGAFSGKFLQVGSNIRMPKGVRRS